MRITEDIKAAISKAIDESGTQLDFAEESGVSQQNLSKYLGGVVKTIRPATWRLLEPKIRKHQKPKDRGHFDPTVLENSIHRLKLKTKIEQLKLQRAYEARKIANLEAELRRMEK